MADLRITDVSFNREVQHAQTLDGRGAFIHNGITTFTITGIVANEDGFDAMRDPIVNGNLTENFARALVPDLFEELERLRRAVHEQTADAVQHVAPDDEERKIDLGG